MRLRTDMAQPTIEQILENAGKAKLKSLPLIMRALRLTSITPFKLTDTAEAHLDKLRVMEPDILDKTLKEILTPEKGGSWGRCATYLMVLMMVLMSLGFAATNIYISLKTGRMLGWQDMMIPLIGPVFIVWYDRGILRKENKDVLMALMGRSPTYSLIESVSSRISNRNDYPREIQQETIDEYPTRTHTSSRKIDY